MRQLDVSVVIPTRDRRASLERTLRALARQHFPPGSFEAIVAVDGEDDGTAACLAALDLPYRLTVVASRGQRGAAAARNVGSGAAAGDLLIFLDDDIEADPALIGEHVQAQRAGARVTIGYLPPRFEGRRDFFQAALRAWWEAMFERMRRPGHRYTFRDLLTGNCGVRASAFEQLGRFDADFRCHEDYEFGVRAMAAGWSMRFVEPALGLHHERTTLARALERKRDEGQADIQMLRKHPHLAPSLPLGVFAAHATRVQRLLQRLAFERPAAGRALAAVLARELAVLERARLRGRWMKRVHDLLTHAYWTGIAGEIDSLAGLGGFLADCTTRSAWSPTVLEVDLGNGLDLVMAQVDRRRPDGLRVTLKGCRVGEIATAPGAEGLRGSHLKVALGHELAAPLLTALGHTGLVGVANGEAGLEATAPLPTEVMRL